MNWFEPRAHGGNPVCVFKTCVDLLLRSTVGNYCRQDSGFISPRSREGTPKTAVFLEMLRGIQEMNIAQIVYNMHEPDFASNISSEDLTQGMLEQSQHARLQEFRIKQVCIAFVCMSSSHPSRVTLIRGRQINAYGGRNHVYLSFYLLDVVAVYRIYQTARKDANSSFRILLGQLFKTESLENCQQIASVCEVGPELRDVMLAQAL